MEGAGQEDEVSFSGKVPWRYKFNLGGLGLSHMVATGHMWWLSSETWAGKARHARVKHTPNFEDLVQIREDAGHLMSCFHVDYMLKIKRIRINFNVATREYKINICSLLYNLLKALFFFFFFFLGLHLRHMEVPKLRVQLELWLPAYATTTAMPDPSHVCDLHQSSWQRWTLNPLSEARGRTRNLMVPSWICFCCATMGTPLLLPLRYVDVGRQGWIWYFCLQRSYRDIKLGHNIDILFPGCWMVIFG